MICDRTIELCVRIILNLTFNITNSGAFPERFIVNNTRNQYKTGTE